MSASSHGSRVFSMASGTLVSRLTGLLRLMVLAWVLGLTPVADSYNLANTIPNMLFDLVLGGVAGAAFIPVFVERLALDGERKAWKSISSVITAATLLLVLASALAWVLAPWIIDGFTVFNHPANSVALKELIAQRAVTTQLLRWFVPQIFFYGVIGVATALLNIRNRFGVSTWVPIANNFVCIAVLVWFHLVDPSPTLSSLNGSSHLMWLGLGTTLGVCVQFLLLLPSLARSDLSRLTPRLNLKDPAVRAVGRLGSWTLMIVIANQISLYVVLAFAFGIGGSGPVSAYSYGWSFMLMPYSVVVVSVLNALIPQIASLATSRDYAALSERLGFGLRQSLVVIIPSTLVLIVLSQPIIAILVKHANASHNYSAGTVLAVLAAGLPGFAVFQLCVRGLQAMQHARVAFYLYAFENALTIVLLVAIGRHSLSGLTASVSIAYSVSAALTLLVLARYQVRITSVVWSRHVRRSFWASLSAALVTAVAYATPTWEHGLGLLLRFSFAVVLGVTAYIGAVMLQQRSVSRRRSKGGRLGQF
ncbi:MAG: murein biosynthesis integral membrane protein MurJ [Acidimicrobiaceae bacterium]|nr:murein biosynthesis integral membrane protein MurJ [Acidimicrobiaceae bacterium]